MTDSNDSRRKITCQCGKTIQQRSYTQHCSSKRHLSFIAEQESQKTDPSASPATTTAESPFSLSLFLREIDLRADAARLRTIARRYENRDPYTKATLNVKEKETISNGYHIDHIHEAQIFACAVGLTKKFLPYSDNVLVLQPVRGVLNDLPNLAVTEASINQSKGQAIRYFLRNYQQEREIPLLAAFLQTSSGKERSIANFSLNIIDLIAETSPTISEAIRQIEVTNGHVTDKSRYDSVAEQFDQIIERMQLDWRENVKLRNGKIYQAYRSKQSKTEDENEREDEYVLVQRD